MRSCPAAPILKVAMTDFLGLLMNIAVITFSISTMLSVGLGHSPREVFAPMLDSRGVIRALLANFVMVPLLALGITRVLPLGASYDTALILIATAAGAPFLMKLTSVARGNVPLAASLTMLLLPATVLYMPFAVPLMVPEARVTPAAIGFPLLWTMILPLILGMMVHVRFRAFAARIQPGIGRLSTVALVVLVAATILANFRGIVQIISRGAFVSPLLLVLGALALGYVLGRDYRGGHVVLGLGTGQRNIAAAMVVATQGLHDPDIVVMLVVISLIELALLFPVAWMLQRSGRRPADMVRA